MLEQKTGLMTYAWLDKEQGASQPRDKMVAYTVFKEGNWLIAGGTCNDEITRESAQLRNRYIGFGLLALAVFALRLFLVVRVTVTRPLALARDAAIQIARGDLSVRMDSGQGDEIGRLAEAMNGISRNLSSVIAQVRDGAEQIATASRQIATGNLDGAIDHHRQARCRQRPPGQADGAQCLERGATGRSHGGPGD